MLRKAVSILLLCVLFVMILGYQLIFYFQLAEVKSAMQQYIHHHAWEKDWGTMVLQKVSDASLVWENDDEFRQGDAMYDVIGKRYEGSKVIVYCIKDKTETDLVNAYYKWNKQQRTPEQMPGFSLLKLLNTTYLLPAGWQPDPLLPSAVTVSDDIDSHFHSHDRFVKSPPPWLASL
jgi:hypothetical protein